MAMPQDREDELQRGIVCNREVNGVARPVHSAVASIALKKSVDTSREAAHAKSILPTSFLSILLLDPKTN